MIEQVKETKKAKKDKEMDLKILGIVIDSGGCFFPNVGQWLRASRLVDQGMLRSEMKAKSIKINAQGQALTNYQPFFTIKTQGREFYEKSK